MRERLVGLQAAIALLGYYFGRLGYRLATHTPQENKPTLICIVADRMKSSIVRSVDWARRYASHSIPLERLEHPEHPEHLAAFWVFVVGATCN